MAKKRNVFAVSLISPIFRQQVLPNKKKKLNKKLARKKIRDTPDE